MTAMGRLAAAISSVACVMAASGYAAPPREGLLSFDVGAHTHQIASQWPTHAPKTFHITNGWSSMGFG